MRRPGRLAFGAQMLVRQRVEVRSPGGAARSLLFRSRKRFGFAADFASDQISITEIKIFGSQPPDEPLGVTIDIRPADRKAVTNLTAGGTVPVAILSTATFDAAAIDRASLTFGRTGNESSLKVCEKTRDVNRDRLTDLVCTFKVRATGLTNGDRTATLKGRTGDGRSIIGQDAVKVRW